LDYLEFLIYVKEEDDETTVLIPLPLEGYLTCNPLLFFSSSDGSSRFSQFPYSPSLIPTPTTYARFTKMLSFRSIFVAAVALATFTSAVPVGTDATPSGASELGLTNVLNGVTKGDGLLKRGGGAPTCKPPADIFQTCHDGIAPIVVEISQ
jgi:hypothetical protein